MTWCFTTIQSFVNILLNEYGIMVPECTKDDCFLRRAERCAVKLGFLECNICESYKDVNASVQTWIPQLMKDNFITYMTTLESLLSPLCYPPEKENDKLETWIHAKYVMQNFPTSEECDLLSKVVHAVIYTKNIENIRLATE